ncbi:MAG: hypothetical protein ACOCT0_02705 [Halobacteriota archaeon]
MSQKDIAGAEQQAKPYLQKLIDVVGAKGTVLMLGLLGAAAAGSAYPSTDDGRHTLVLAGSLLITLALAAAVAVDRAVGDTDEVDVVGVTMTVLAAAYTTAVALGAVPGWRYAGVSAVLLLGVVAVDYLRAAGEDDPLQLDVVGFVVAELLVVYAVLVYAGWTEIAHHPAFAALAFVVASTFLAVTAGYSVVRREVVVSPESELNELLVAVLREVKDVADEDVRADISSQLRLMAEKLDGYSLPTEIEDRYGGVPVVLPDEEPTWRKGEASTESVFEAAREERTTGYALHGEDLHLFRNGGHVLSFVEGEYTDEPTGVDADCRVYETSHAMVNQLESILPAAHEELPEPEPEAEEAETVSGESQKVLNVGGQEVDIQEMFEKADDIIEDLSE